MWPFLPVNPNCTSTPCAKLTPSNLLTYAGPNLPCTGINSCDTISVSLQKIDEVICILQASPVVNPGSSGVQSVTGSAVDNTDPLNPIINLGGGGGKFGLEDNIATEARNFDVALYPFDIVGIQEMNIGGSQFASETNIFLGKDETYSEVYTSVNCGYTSDNPSPGGSSASIDVSSYNGVDNDSAGVSAIELRAGNWTNGPLLDKLIYNARVTFNPTEISFKQSSSTYLPNFSLASSNLAISLPKVIDRQGTFIIPISVDGNFADATGNITLTTTSTTTAIPNPRILIGLISQSGTDAPIIDILENTTGLTITTEYFDVGKYYIVFTDPSGLLPVPLLPDSKIYSIIASDIASIPNIYKNSDTKMIVKSLDFSGTFVNNSLWERSFEMKIYN